MEAKTDLVIEFHDFKPDCEQGGDSFYRTNNYAYNRELAKSNFATAS